MPDGKGDYEYSRPRRGGINIEKRIKSYCKFLKKENIMFKKLKSKINEKLKANKFTADIIENYDFKTMVFAVISYGITLVFALMNLVSAIRYHLIYFVIDSCE